MTDILHTLPETNGYGGICDSPGIPVYDGLLHDISAGRVSFPSDPVEPVPDSAPNEPASQEPGPKTEAGLEPVPTDGVRRWRAAKLTGQAAVAIALLSPLNEAIRFGAVTAGYAYSRSPAMGALTAGGSTLLVEAAAGLATAGVLGTPWGRRVATAVNNRLRNVTIENLSPVTKATTALFFGTVASMALEQTENPSRTVEQNRRYAWRTSALLAGVLAVGGALGIEAVNKAIEKPVVAIPVAGAVVALEAVRRVVRKMRYPKRVKDIESETWKDRDEHYTYHLITDADELRKAAILEQAVWDEKGFGKLDEEGYTSHIEASRTFGAFDESEGECIGVNRTFGGAEGLQPPFLSLPFDDEEKRQTMLEGVRRGEVEELGTVAVRADARGKGVNSRLWRLAYRDAAARGIKQWGIIMEPERVKKLNKHHGFTFRQLGPAVKYQGGMCAAHILDMDEVVRNLQRKHLPTHLWFVRKALKS